MVAELSGSMVILSSAIGASFLVAAVLVDMANSYDTNVITNISINAWDRFGSSDLVWVEVVMTYPGGPLEISGDINLCFEPATAGGNCEITNLPPKDNCGAAGLNNTKHGCWSVKKSGSANQFRYEGIVNVGFDAERDDPLGYVVSSRLHDKSGTVGVR